MKKHDSRYYNCINYFTICCNRWNIYLNKKKGGTFLDLFSKKYKDYNPDFEWEKFETIRYIAIVRVRSVKYSNLAHPQNVIKGLTYSLSYLYKLTIVIDVKKRERVTVFKHNNKDLVFEKAFELKEYFQCCIYDCSSHRKKWIR